MEDKDKDMVIVVALGCNYLEKPVVGSLIRNCDDCNAEVWISPSWQGKKIDRIICLNCYNKNVGTDSYTDSYKGEKGEVVTCLTEENIEEFNDHFEEKHGYRMSKDEIIKMVEIELGRKVMIKEKAE